MNPKVSVVIPIYNVEDYLEECLCSVINQTFENIEVILVNDGSTDRSLEIILSFSKKDRRIKIYNQINKGVSAARNSGIALTTGEYILFVDGDDIIIHNAIEELYHYAVGTNADLVIGNVLYSFPNGKKALVFDRKGVNNISNIVGYECYVKLMEIDAFPPLPCLFFIKRTVVRDGRLFFKEGIIHEDELWCVRAMFNSTQVTLVDFNYYIYRQREGSIMNSDNKSFRIKSLFIVIDELKKFVLQLKEKNISQESVGYIFARFFFIYRVMSRIANDSGENLSFIIDYFSDMLIEIFPALTYFQQRYCLQHYYMATFFLKTRI